MKDHSANIERGANQFLFLMILSLIFIFTGFLFIGCATSEVDYNRGIGVYPGDPKEDYSPELYSDKTIYRNIALNRPVYQSSSYDYNLTSQLVTDGILHTKFPMILKVSSSDQPALAKREREWLIDRHFLTGVDVSGSRVWVQISMENIGSPPEVDRVEFIARLKQGADKRKGWKCIILGSNDGTSWQKIGSTGNGNYPGELLPITPWRPGPDRFRRLEGEISFYKPYSFLSYKIVFEAPIADYWNIGGIDFYRNDHFVEFAPSHSFTSAWKSAGTDNEWIYVDLGTSSLFDRIRLHWINPASDGKIQVSDDASNWVDIFSLSEERETSNEFLFDPPASGRYVRVLMTKPASGDGYLLSEIEIYGYGGILVKPKPMSRKIISQRMNLAGGSWRVQRAPLVAEDGLILSQPGYDDENWIPATVPATVLVSYLNAGVLPDPNYGDNQLLISESFFNSAFWYRNEFEFPSSSRDEHTFLNFDGINWKAEVFLNGINLGSVEGAFMRGRFDITEIVRPGNNAIVVLIEKNANPGSVKEQNFESSDRNGGILGADNPTFHASIGWDWIPTIRGRNTGIWNDVYLTFSGPVTIEDPFITTGLPLPDTSSADVAIELLLRNNSLDSTEGELIGNFGAVQFEESVSLAASEIKRVKLDPTTHNVLRIQNPKLWWPNGYGKQNLYNVILKFKTKNGDISDSKLLKTGLRELSYNDSSGALEIHVNGRRFIGRGGNWGFPESMLRYRSREYDVAVRYHKEMNFTMIRNWVGQTGDKEFYEACDKSGIMIWQDFWLANPVDGPNPYDNEMFMNNVVDYVKRIRNHPSIALYCGRNEGNPPEELDRSIREILPKTHPGLHYISHSSIGTVSGFGPYGRMPVKYYFENRATPKFHSELGMPNIVSYESLQKMLPESGQWPIGDMWGLHDFCQFGAMRSGTYMKMFEKHFGQVDNVKDWIALAQFMNYDGYRAMFEAQGKNRMGLLIWMSHPAWPSFVWQTYDFYFEPTAAYFGCKKASEPLHIQWNAMSDSVEVVNYSAGNRSGLTVTAKLFNLDGTLMWENSDTLDSKEDSVSPLFNMEYPDGLTNVHFIRLTLNDEDETISQNFYWRGLEYGNYQVLRNLPKVNIDSNTNIERIGNKWLLTTSLHNPSTHPALMIRLKVIREKSGDRILPLIFSDNYVSLMPGESSRIKMTIDHSDTRGEKPQVVISGFNVEEKDFAL